MKFIKKIILSGILFILLILIGLKTYINRNQAAIKVDESPMITYIKPAYFENKNIDNQAQLSGSTNNKYALQSRNSCGPYSIAFALQLLGITIDPELISTTITWRKTPRSITYPPGVEEYISKITKESDKIGFNTINLGKISDSYKAYILQLFITSGSPVIALIDYKGFQHYVVVVGYDKMNKYIYIYNPLKEDNNEGPGNERLTEQEFLTMRSKGGQYGLYKYYGIVIYPKQMKEIYGF